MMFSTASLETYLPRCVDLEIRKKLLKTYEWSVAVYGWKAWTIGKEERRRLQATWQSSATILLRRAQDHFHAIKFQYTRCVRKVSDLRSYLRVGAILRHPDRSILRSSPHLIEPPAPSGASTS